MSRKIMVEPSRLDTAASKIEALVGEYQKLYAQLYSEVDGLGAAWKGQDNVAFVTQIKGFEDDFQNMSAIMSEYARFLRDSATKYRETQTEVMNSARRLAN